MGTSGQGKKQPMSMTCVWGMTHTQEIFALLVRIGSETELGRIRLNTSAEKGLENSHQIVSQSP